jgi:hypothetical protein
VFTIIYVADGAAAEPVTPGQVFDRRSGCPTRDRAAPSTPWLNPVVWARDGRHRDTVAHLPGPAPGSDVDLG